jgi:hypothetical protein
MNYITPETIAEIVNMSKAGKSNRQIQERLHVSSHTIIKYANSEMLRVGEFKYVIVPSDDNMSILQTKTYKIETSKISEKFLSDKQCYLDACRDCKNLIRVFNWVEMKYDLQYLCAKFQHSKNCKQYKLWYQKVVLGK